MKKKYKYGSVAIATLLSVMALVGCTDEKSEEEVDKGNGIVKTNEEGKQVFSDYLGYDSIKLDEKIQEIWVVFNGNTDYYHLSYKDETDPNFQSSVYAKDTLKKVSDYGIVDLLYGQTLQEIDPVTYTTAFEELGNTYFNGITIIQNVVEYGSNTGGENKVDWKTFKQAYDNTIVELGVTIEVLEGIKVEGVLGKAVKEATVLSLKDGLEGLKGLEKHLDKDKLLYGMGESETQDYMVENINPALYASDYLYDLYYGLVEGTVNVAYEKKDVVHEELQDVYEELTSDEQKRKDLLVMLKGVYKDTQNVLFTTLSNIDMQFAMTSGAYKDLADYKSVYNEQIKDAKSKYTRVKEKVDNGNYSKDVKAVADVMLDSMLEGINSREKYLLALKEEKGVIKISKDKLLEAEQSKATATTLNISLYKVYDLLSNEEGYNDVFYTTSNVQENGTTILEGGEVVDDLNIDVYPDDWEDKETGK